MKTRITRTVIMMAITWFAFLCVGCNNQSTNTNREGNARGYKIASTPSTLDMAPNYGNGNRDFIYKPAPGGYQFATLENNAIQQSRSVNDPTVYGTIVHDQPTDDAVASEYHVGSGDVLLLKIDQLMEPDKEAILKVEVDRNGMIYLPILNHVNVAGMTIDDIQKTLLTTLASNYIKDPKVDVSVDSYQSRKVLVLGEVRSPGSIALRHDAVPLLEVINEAGGLTSNVSPYVEIMRGAYKNFSELSQFDDGIEYRNYRGNQYQRELVPLSRVLGEGSLDQINPLVRSGDVIRILPISEGFVYFSGEFNLRGSQAYRRPLTIIQAMAMAGGPSDIAKSKECRIIRRNSDGTESEFRVNVDKILEGKDENIILACNDTIILPVDPWKKFWKGFFGLFTGGVRVGVDTTYNTSEALGWPGSDKYFMERYRD